MHFTHLLWMRHWYKLSAGSKDSFIFIVIGVIFSVVPHCRHRHQSCSQWHLSIKKRKTAEKPIGLVGQLLFSPSFISNIYLAPFKENSSKALGPGLSRPILK